MGLSGKKEMQKESVWDYPRPPKLDMLKGHVRIVHEGKIIADSNKAARILETSHPPTVYIPIEDIKMESFIENTHQSFCEFKGMASYVDFPGKTDKVQNVGWFYKSPSKNYPELKGKIAFYASKFDECYINDEQVSSQEGDFYGGWITSNIQGPFKGAPGTWGW